MDVISRADAIRWVKTECNPYGKPTLDFESGKKVIEHLEQMPSAQPKTFHVIDILTGKEADPYDIALNENWAKDLMYCDMEGFAIEEDGSLILVDECGRFEYCPIGRFEVVWDG